MKASAFPLVYDRMYRGRYKMPNGHAGPWAVLSKLSPMKTFLVIDLCGQKDVAVAQLLWRERGSERSRQVSLFPFKSKEGVK
jgi:hypothetical protein